MFSAREVSRLAGFAKPWMLNHLELEEIFTPEITRATHHGKHRNYTFKDLVVLRAINRLLKLGARPKRIKAAISKFSEVCPDVIGDMTLAGMQLKFAQEAGHFIIDAESVLYVRTPDEIVDLIKNGQMAFSFMIDSASSILPSLQAAAEVIDWPPLKRESAQAIEEIAKRYAI